MENVNQGNKKLGLKKPKRSILPIIFSGILAAGALGGSGVAIWQVAKNYTDSGEFTKTVTGRVEVDPLANFSEQERAAIDDKREVEPYLADCAERLSRWLKDQGQKSYDVSYELYDVDEIDDEDFPEDQKFVGYLSANFEVDKIQSRVIFSDDDKDKKIDNDPYLSFFNEKAFNTNEKTLVYRWWTQPEHAGEKPVYSFIPFRDLFTIPEKVGVKSDKSKVLVDKDGNNGVVYKIDSDTVNLNDIFTDLYKAKKYSEEQDPENKEIKNWDQPRLYVVNNINNLYNEVNYHLSNWLVNQENRDYRKIYENTQYVSIAKEYNEKTFDGESKTQPQKDESFHLASANDHESTAKAHDNADVFNYIDQATPGAIAADWSFVNKYIPKVVTMNDYQNFMPEKITDDYKNDVDVDGGTVKINYFWYQLDTKDNAEKFLNNEITYGFKKSSISNISFENISDLGKDGARKVLDRMTKTKFKSVDVAPSFTKTIFGGSQLVATLSIGFLAFLVVLLIILAALYRTTGVMSWICMMFALSMTLFISTLGSTAISLSLIFGLFTIAIAGFMAAIAICGRMKRRLNSHEDTQLMIKKTFIKSLLPVIDISIVTLIFGICFTYIAPIMLNPLGLALIIGAFAIFISVYLLNGLLHGLFFNNKIMINKYSFFGKPTNIANEALTQGNIDTPSSLDATKLEFAYYSSMSKKKIDVTNKKALIAVAVIGIILAACIVAFILLDWKSNTIFHTTNCLAIYSTDNNVLEWVKDLDYLSYSHDTTSGWWYFYTNASNIEQIARQIADLQGISYGESIFVQNIVGSTNQDILNFALISVLAAAGCSCIYGAIRFNWIAFIPLLVGIFAMPLIILGLSSVAQVKFDQFVVIAFVFVVVINTIFCLDIVGRINESWSRKDPYNSVEFKFIVNIALTNSWTYIWNVALAYGLLVAAFGVASPVGLWSAIVLLMIGLLITIALAPITIAFLLYRFMLIRNKALSRLVQRNAGKVVINYDEIDEQGIEGINKFTKKIPVAKEAPQGAK